MITAYILIYLFITIATCVTMYSIDAHRVSSKEDFMSSEDDAFYWAVAALWPLSLAVWLIFSTVYSMGWLLKKMKSIIWSIAHFKKTQQ